MGNREQTEESIPASERALIALSAIQYMLGIINITGVELGFIKRKLEAGDGESKALSENITTPDEFIGGITRRLSTIAEDMADFLNDTDMVAGGEHIAAILTPMIEALHKEKATEVRP